MPLTAQLVTQSTADAAWLQFYGGYCSDAVRDAVLSAGWRVPVLVPLVQLPEQYLTPSARTDAFSPPHGAVGRLTKDEAALAQKRLRAVLKPLGIALPRSVRRLTFADLI